MAGFQHGKSTVIKLDNLAGSITDISSFVKDSKYDPKTDRPETQHFGAVGKRHQVTGLREAGLSLSGNWQAVSGTQVHGKSTKILLDAYALTGYLNKGSIKRTVDLPETQHFGDTWKRRQVVGLIDEQVSFSGLFDSVAGAVFDRFRAGLAVDPPGFGVLSIGLNGFAIGGLVEMLSSVVVDQGIASNVDNATELSGNLVSDNEFEIGVSLHDLTAETTTGNFASVNNTAATATGGVGHLHVTAFSGTDGTVKIQHSTDDAIFADLITFTSVTGITSQRSELAAGTSVNQYVRAAITVDNFTSMTLQVSFARRSVTSATAAAGTHRYFVGLFANASTSTFEYGPDGAAGGALKIHGEVRLQDYSVDFDENDVTSYSATFVNDGAITENGTF